MLIIVTSNDVTLVMFVVFNVGLVVFVEFGQLRKWLEAWWAGSLQGPTTDTTYLWPSNSHTQILFCRACQCRQFFSRISVSGLSPVELDFSSFNQRQSVPWFQVVLLDLYELWRLRVEYMPQLQMYEELHKLVAIHSMRRCLDEESEESKLEKEWTIEIVAKHRMPVEVRLFISWNSDHLEMIEISLQFLQ